VARRQRNGLIATCREEGIGADQQKSFFSISTRALSSGK
jgi:hypothetical protein